jgi:hypothetical protein
MSTKEVSSRTNGINNIYLPSNFNHPITIVMHNGNDKNIIKIIPTNVSQEIKNIKNVKEASEVKNPIKTNKYNSESRPALTIEQIRNGAKKYCDHIVQLSESRTKFINDTNKSINVGQSLFKYNVITKFLWHYGPKTNNNYDLKVYEDNNIVLGFKQAQQILKEKGYKLLDISNPKKGQKFIIILTTIDNDIPEEKDSIWHGLNVLN